MPESSPQNTRAKVRKIYGLGILAFSAIVGFITLLGLFLDRVKIQ